MNRSQNSSKNSKNLASSSCGLRPLDTGKIMEQGEGVRREPQGSTILTPRFATNHAEPFISHWRNVFSKLYDGKSEKSNLGAASRKIPRSSGLQCWTVNFNEVCANSSCPTITLLCITEVEIAKSGTLLCRRISLILKCLMRSVEQRAQKHYRFLRGRQIACMVADHFRATGAYDASQT